MKDYQRLSNYRQKQGGFLGKIFKGVSKVIGGITGNSVLGAGASLLGGQLANSARADAAQTVGNFNQASAREANEFSASESLKTRQFQKWMSNTAHQREIKDLKGAGLNPILAAKYGGASTPSGSAASGHAASMPLYDQQDIFTPAVNTALNAQQTQSNVNKQNAEIGKIDAEIQKIGADLGLTKAQTTHVKNSLELLAQQTKKEGWLSVQEYMKSKSMAATYRIVADMTVKEAELAIKLVELDKNLYGGQYGQSVRNLENASKGGSALGIMAGIGSAAILTSGGLFGTIIKKFAGNKAILKKIEQYASGLTPKQRTKFWSTVDTVIGNNLINKAFK